MKKSKRKRKKNRIANNYLGMAAISMRCFDSVWVDSTVSESRHLEGKDRCL